MARRADFSRRYDALSNALPGVVIVDVWEDELCAAEKGLPACVAWRYWTF